MNLIEHEKGLTFENMYVYSKSLYQPKYIYFEFYNLLKNWILLQVRISKTRKNSLFIFDDIARDNQGIIRE